MTERASQFYFIPIKDGQFVNEEGGYYRHYSPEGILPISYFDSDGSRKSLDHLTSEQKSLIFATPEAEEWHRLSRQYFQQGGGGQPPIRPAIVPLYSWEIKHPVSETYGGGQRLGGIHEKGRERFMAIVGVFALGVGILAGVSAAGTGTSPENIGIAAVRSFSLIYLAGRSINLFSRMRQIENYQQGLTRS